MPLNSFSEVTPIIAAQVWLPADGTNTKVILGPQPTSWRMDTLIAVNDDSAARTITLTLYDPSGTLHGIGDVSVPSLAGHTPNPSVDLLGTLLPAAQVGIAVPPGWELRAHLPTAVTSALGVVLYGGYF